MSTHNNIDLNDLNDYLKEIQLFPIVSVKSKKPVTVRQKHLKPFNSAFQANFKLSTEFYFYSCLIRIIISGHEYWLVRFAFKPLESDYFSSDSIYFTQEEAIEIHSFPSKFFTDIEYDVYLFEKNKQKTVDEMMNEVDLWLQTSS